MAIIVPNEANCKAWAKRKGVKVRTMADYCQNKRLLHDILQEFNYLNKEGRLCPHEQVLA